MVAGLGRLLIRSPLSSPWLAITATVVVAVAFDPLRRRLERGVSRLVYGRRGSPYDVLASFTRQATTIEAGVLEQVARLLAEAMGAREAAVWVRTDGQMTRAAAWPSGEDRPDSSPQGSTAFLQSVPVDGAFVLGHSSISGPPVRMAKPPGRSSRFPWGLRNSSGTGKTRWREGEDQRALI